MWASWRVRVMPEPSRLPCMPDRSTGTPDMVAPSAGPGPAQAVTRWSSPLRKRWQRTPPVARPLGGYSAKGVTLTLAAPAPGSAPDLPATVTTTAASAVVVPTAPNQTTDAPDDSRMPAMPPAGRPCGRTEAAANRSSCASEVMNTSSASSSEAWTAPITRSSSRRVISSNSSRLAGYSGITRLTTPLAVPSATPAFAASRFTRAITVSPGSSAVANSVMGWPPASDGATSLGGSAGISRTLSLIMRPPDVTAPTVPRAVAELERDRGLHRFAALQQHRAARGAELLRQVGHLAADHLAQPAVVGED